jgi:hypothetical protein
MTKNGQTPAEIGERAAREDQAFRKGFLAKLKDPQVVKAARQAVRAIAVLEGFGLKVNDWSATGSRIEEIEVEDTLKAEKGWIKVED